MDTLEQKILRAFRGDSPEEMSFRQLMEILQATPDETHDIRLTLNEMTKQGILISLKGNRYTLSGLRKIVTGKLWLHRQGFGFVRPDDKQAGIEEDVLIPARFVGDAMAGDTVMVTTGLAPGGRVSEGRILKVLVRKHRTVVGCFKPGIPDSVVTPDDPGLPFEILVRDGEDMDAPEGSMVNVEITRFPHGSRRPRGRVIEILGFRGTFGVDVEMVIRKYQIPVRFPESVLTEVKGLHLRLGDEDLTGRMDFRSLPIVTIDGETAKDFDDAVHVDRLSNGNYLLGVHIADVSHYVKKDSPLDREARTRGTSVYFPDRAVPMLPEELSNGICSLKPQEDRLTLSALMEIGSEGEVSRYSFLRGVIRSRERMTYTAVGRILIDRDPDVIGRYQELVPHFELMRELASILYERRRRLGSIDFDLPEPVIEFDAAGLMSSILKSERNISHRIIEEFMLAANETVARHLFQASIPSLYRIHESPDPIKVLEFNEVAKGFGYQLGSGLAGQGTMIVPRVKDRVRPGQNRDEARRLRQSLQALNVKVFPADYQRLVDQLAGKPEERILSYLMLRSLQQAVYSPHNQGHFGLASNCYTHFTSPIRRYPDLMVHRILKGLLPAQSTQEFKLPNVDSVFHHAFGARKQRPVQSSPSLSSDRRTSFLYALEELEDIALQSSQTERRAADAERDLIE
ncbi:MAG TPA: VacB/RNase II family 3'-5' exoribonuclease, partial [Terriglobia bacterium]|nr:VacB/RNase II family 3'-5' exoribonuclease [Terriglobia bacterium]